jgi:hypothetical protein
MPIEWTTEPCPGKKNVPPTNHATLFASLWARGEGIVAVGSTARVIGITSLPCT